MPKNKPTNRYKIGFVLDDSLDTPDGVQQYVLTLSTWLTAQGHDVHYLVGESTRTDIPQLHSLSRNMKVRFNGNRMSMPLPANKARIRELLAREQFDVLHVQMPYSPFLAGRLIAAAPRETAVVGTFHVAPHSRMVYAANKMLRVMARRSLRRFDAVMSVSSVAQAFAREAFRLESDIIPNTVDLAPFNTAKPLPAYETGKTILFLGRLVDRKGCGHLLRALAYMQEHKLFDGDYRAVICGKGPLEDELKQYMRSKHLQKHVEFVGFVSEADKPAYMASADIAVFPSTGGESFGIVLVESMAAARGVTLAGNNPGYASVMAPFPETLIEPADTESFGRTLVDLLARDAHRARLAAQQRADVMQYDVPVVGARVVALYERALHKRAA